MGGVRALSLLVLLALACFVMANNETLPDFKKSRGNEPTGTSPSENRKFRKQEEGTEEWRRKIKKMSKELAEKMANQKSPDKNDEQYKNYSMTELQDAADKDKLITAVQTRLSTFSGPLSSRAKDSLSSLDRNWSSLSNDTKGRALETLRVISSNIEAYGNAGEDPISAMKAATNILASISSNFGPRSQLARKAQGFVPALLGLFGKGPKPKPFRVFVRKYIKESLSKFPNQDLSETRKKTLIVLRRAKKFLDRAAKSGKKLNNQEMAVAMRFMEITPWFFPGVLANLLRYLFSYSLREDIKIGLRYCEMYAHLALYHDIIQTQYIAMIPDTPAWQGQLNATIGLRTYFRNEARKVLGKLYVVRYESWIIPGFDPDVSVITDTYSTKILNLGKYDRSMTGLYCLMTPGSNGLKDLIWERADKRYQMKNKTYTTISKRNNKNCYWKIIPHAGNTYSIVNKYKCKEKYEYCGSFLSWHRISVGKNDVAFAYIDENNPRLWEIGGHDWKYIRNKWGCGNNFIKRFICDFDLRVEIRAVKGTPQSPMMNIKKVGTLLPPNGKYYWKLRRASVKDLASTDGE